MTIGERTRIELPDRIRLAVLPTALTDVPRLAAEFGLDSLHIKRDDLTGFAIGGNKARPLEYLVADACRRGCDTLLTGGAAGSNFCVAAAAAAKRAGLFCHLVIAGHPRKRAPGPGLARAWGASVSWTRSQDRASVDSALPAAAARLTSLGRRPYVIPRGGATAVGSIGYVQAADELFVQLSDGDLRPTCVVVAVGSGGTLAGLVAGNALLGWPWRIVGASVSRPPEEISGRVLKLAKDCLSLLASCDPAIRDAERATDSIAHHRVEIVDARGPGHALASESGRAAADAAMRTEGLAVDPTYTAKALAVLGAVGERAAVFWHTGGMLDVFTQTPVEAR